MFAPINYRMKNQNTKQQKSQRWHQRNSDDEDR